MSAPPFTFVLVFLLFSLIFLSNTYKLWLKTDSYYRDLLDSLNRTPTPFKNVFLKGLENRPRWEKRQKIFSLLGLVAVIAMDIFVVMAYIN
ncbi:MAG: hypothetical protein PHQ36_13375 [Anaerolineales bacterium]|nr:hypothetical protein [Anaerolineales bacterium]